MRIKKFIPFFLILAIVISPSVGAVTIESGTVLNASSSNSSVTFSFDVNVTNFTVEPSYVLLYGINYTNSTGKYICEDVNHSIPNSSLDSSRFNCSLEEGTGDTDGTEDTEDIGSNDGGGGRFYYFYEENKFSEGNTLKLRVRMEKDEQIYLEPYNQRDTNISKIVLNSRDYLSGEIEISKRDILLASCDISEKENEYIYKIIQVNSTVDEENLENVTLWVDVDNLWIERNKITEIGGMKCPPSAKGLKASLIQRYENYSTYSLSSDGFSTWVVFGVRETGVPGEANETGLDNVSTGEINETVEEYNETTEVPGENESQNITQRDKEGEGPCCFTILNICWYWWLVFVLLLLAAIWKIKYGTNGTKN